MLSVAHGGVAVSAVPWEVAASRTIEKSPQPAGLSASAREVGPSAAAVARVTLREVHKVPTPSVAHRASVTPLLPARNVARMGAGGVAALSVKVEPARFTVAMAPYAILGGSSGTHFTANVWPMLQGLGQPGDVVQISADGQRAGSAVVAADGVWSLQVGPLSGGRHRLTATETALAGTTHVASAAMTTTVPRDPMTTTATCNVVTLIQDGLLTVTGAVTCGASILSSLAEAGLDLTVVGDILGVPLAEVLDTLIPLGGLLVSCVVQPSGCSQNITQGLIGAAIGLIPYVDLIAAPAYECANGLGSNLSSFITCLQDLKGSGGTGGTGTGGTGTGAALTQGAPVFPNSTFYQGMQLLANGRNFAVTALGSAKWLNVAPTQVPREMTLLKAVAASFGPNSPGGVRATFAERAAIERLPRPFGITRADVDALLAHLSAIAGDQSSNASMWKLIGATTALTTSVKGAMDLGWRSMFDLVTSGISSSSSELGALLRSKSLGVVPGVLDYRLDNWATGAVARGQVVAGAFTTTPKLSPDSLYSIEYLDPRTGRIGMTTFRTGASGTTAQIPEGLLGAPANFYARAAILGTFLGAGGGMGTVVRIASGITAPANTPNATMLVSPSLSVTL